jgi:hypothetical protein
MFFDVGFDWEEILLNELSGFVIVVRLGIQPSAGASRGGGAEVDQNGTAFLFRLSECLIDVLTPTYGHGSNLL